MDDPPLAELHRLREERTYPTFGPLDDDFHDEHMSSRWWETETCWFSWNVPDRSLGGWTYCQARPNARLCNGGAWVWDANGAYPWELSYRADYSGLELPPRTERDMRDFAWPNGVTVRVLEPLRRYGVFYDDPGGLELDMEFTAIMEPNPHPTGVHPFRKGVHFDQAGHLKGTMVLRGETIPIDCYSVRDRSWGPRPMGPARPSATGRPTPTFGGVGYSFCAASAHDAWLVYVMPGAGPDVVVCGFLLEGGRYGHILAGQRQMSVDPESGWPVKLEIRATDEFGRTLEVGGNVVSRHWRGHGSDSLVHWEWEPAGGHVEGWGEDQSYFTRDLWEEKRRRARSRT